MEAKMCNRNDLSGEENLHHLLFEMENPMHTVQQASAVLYALVRGGVAGDLNDDVLMFIADSLSRATDQIEARWNAACSATRAAQAGLSGRDGLGRQQVILVGCLGLGPVLGAGLAQDAEQPAHGQGQDERAHEALERV